MIARSLALTGMGLLVVAGLSGCESTQSRSAELEEEGEKALAVDAGLRSRRRAAT